MGILRIHGTIDIKQFWPVQESDADTTKIKLLVTQNLLNTKKTVRHNLRKHLPLMMLYQRARDQSR